MDWPGARCDNVAGKGVRPGARSENVARRFGNGFVRVLATWLDGFGTKYEGLVRILTVWLGERI